MKLRGLVIAVAVLLVLAFATWLLDRPGETEEVGYSKSLVDAEELATIDEILVSDNAGNTARISKTDAGRWVLPDYHDIPADFDQLLRLTRQLEEAEVRRRVTSNPDRLARLDLGQTEIRLRSGGGDIVHLSLGGVSKSGGAFVAFPQRDEKAAYLLDTTIYSETQEEAWAEKELLPLADTDIKSITIPLTGVQGGSLTFARPEEGKPLQLDSLAEGENIRRNELNRITSALANLRYTEVVPGDAEEVEAARKNAYKYLIETFDGEKITVQLGRKPETPPEPAEGEEAAETPAEEETSQAFVFIEHSDDAFPWEDITGRVGLAVSDFAYGVVPETREDLIFKESPRPAQPQPGQPANPVGETQRQGNRVVATTPPIKVDLEELQRQAEQARQDREAAAQEAPPTPPEAEQPTPPEQPEAAAPEQPEAESGEAAEEPPTPPAEGEQPEAEADEANAESEPAPPKADEAPTPEAEAAPEPPQDAEESGTGEPAEPAGAEQPAAN